MRTPASHSTSTLTDFVPLQGDKDFTPSRLTFPGSREDNPAMPWILFAAVVALPVLGVAFLRPVRYHVSRSIRISKPAADVFSAVADLQEWPKWSPWLYVEPEAELEFRGDGKSVGSSYSWEGELVGKGEIEITKAEGPGLLELEIRFQQPFKSTAEVAFSTEEKDGETEITWSMNGQIPMAMRKSIAAWIGMDYERGLAMLKSLLETGKIPSVTEVVGEVEREEVHFVGSHEACHLDVIGESMEKAFGELKGKLSEINLDPSGPSLCIYREYDLVTRECLYTAAAPVDPEKIPDELPEGLVEGKLPEHHAFEVVHTGPFEFLANGWATGFQLVRYKKLGQRKGMFPYEVYARAPENTPAEEVRTEIFFPIK